ncbi:type VII secretion target [Pseudonocardia hispaniensis]|uniref:Type VII secretion target n=1 Tax=Pseudonocardia hispaniensis TaxID=904933 RepID=A0ABW1J585_9PSEU
MSGGFTVDLAELGTHAGQVDAVANRLATAADAGRPLSRDAYGLIGQIFADAAAETAARSSVLVRVMARAATLIADGVRCSGTSYAATERSNVARFREIR